MATITTEQLAACKEYLRVDLSADDALITNLMAGAMEYLNIADLSDASPQQQLAVWSLTLHRYDHRDDVDGQTPFPIGLRPIINQLKAEAEVAAAAEAAT